MTETHEELAPNQAYMWQAFADVLAASGLQVLATFGPGRSSLEQAELTESMVHTLIGELLTLANADPDRPDWAPILNGMLRRYAANADTTYQAAYIRGSGIYRILGRRGTTKLVHLQVGVGTMGIGDPDAVKLIGNLNIDDCEIGPDGTFEVILSARRPEGYTGAWLALDETREDSYALMRQVAADWMTEVDPQVSIQRIDKPIGATAKTSSTLTDNLIRVAQFVRDDTFAMLRLNERQKKLVDVNQISDISTYPWEGGGIDGQGYNHGLIELGEDQVWVASFEVPPACPYWGVQLMDYGYNTLDPMYTQSTLNTFSAVPDQDGIVRIVACGGDPGIANWLDTGGLRRLQIRFRWYDTPPPKISSEVVARSQLDAVLPATTARVSSQTRQEALRRRAIGMQWRRRW